METDKYEDGSVQLAMFTPYGTVIDTIKSEQVNHPAHYNHGSIEVIDYIEDKELGFSLGNAVKYISRAGHKNKDKTIEDLEKAVWYVQREINRLKKEAVNEKG